MKLVKVNHVVLGLKVAPSGQGYSQAEIDELVNRRLGEGYDEVQIFPIKTNLDERQQATDYVQLYIFKKYEDAVDAEAVAVKSKKA